MKRDNGLLGSAIWLLADSPPLILLDKRFDEYEPLDWRFPTRHNIWTPIETIMNRELFRLQKVRIDDSRFYVRNAVKAPEDWKRENKAFLAEDVKEFRGLVEEHSPFLILTFGRRAFEFARRSQENDEQSFSEPFPPRSIAELSREFDTRMFRFRNGKGVLLPLLHKVIALQFEKCNDGFRGNGDPRNYYEHVGCELASFLNHQFQCGNERLSKLLL